MRKSLTYLLTGFAIFAVTSSVEAQQFQRETFQTPQRGQKVETPTAQVTPASTSTQDQDSDGKIGVMGEVTAKHMTLDYCYAELIADVDVPAQETGKLLKIHVKEGDEISVDSNLAQIDDSRVQLAKREATFKFDQASRQALDETSIKAAKRRAELTQEEFERNQKLFAKGSVSEFEYKRSLYQREISELEYQGAINDRDIAKIEAETQAINVEAANESIGRHKIKSTLDGNVFQILKEEGEWVQAGEPILRIGRMDKLQISGHVDSKKVNPPDVEGCRVTAFVKLANDEEIPFTGKVTFVSLETHADKFEIKVEIDNKKYKDLDSTKYGTSDRWVLNTGVEMNIRVHFDKGPVASSGFGTQR